MEIEGKIRELKQTQEVGSANFKKRDLVITTDETYPQHILIQFVQDKCELLNSYKVGESVKIDVNIRGREWTNQQGETFYFNTIQGWKITKSDTSKQIPTPAPAQQQSAPPTPSTEEEPDDLPF